MDFAPGDPASWDEIRNSAEAMMEQDLELQWYRAEAVGRGLDPIEKPMDPSLLTDPIRLNRLSCLKTLEEIYLWVQKDSKEADGFERQRVLFKDKYRLELTQVTTEGVEYDWESAGGSIVDSTNRRLVRM